MKVLRVIARLNVGGPARHVMLANRGLDARGHETRLVFGSTSPDEASFEHLAAEWNLRTMKIPQLGRRIRFWGDVAAFVQLLAIVHRFEPDVVHTHTAKAGALGRIAAATYNVTRRRHARCLVVHTFHGHVLEGYFRPTINRVIRAVEAGLAAISDTIVTISAHQRVDIVERFRVAAARKVLVIPLGLELEPLLQLGPDAPHLRVALGLSGDACVVGYVGRLVPIKELSTLLEAFARARRSRNNLRLIVAGDGSERRALEQLAVGLGIANDVRFIGWIDDLPRLYATFDICALSSRNEGTPVAVIEGMAAGKPIAATAVGGVVDLVVPGEHGLLVPAGDVGALAMALEQLAASPAERARMGVAGRALVARVHTPSRLVNDLEAAYVEGLTKKRG